MYNMISIFPSYKCGNQSNLYLFMVILSPYLKPVIWFVSLHILCFHWLNSNIRFSNALHQCLRMLHCCSMWGSSVKFNFKLRFKFIVKLSQHQEFKNCHFSVLPPLSRVSEVDRVSVLSACLPPRLCPHTHAPQCPAVTPTLHGAHDWGRVSDWR